MTTFYCHKLLALAAGIAAVFFSASGIAAPIAATPQGGSAWTRNFRSPSTVAVQFQAAFNVIGVAQVSLGGQTASVTNDFDPTCGDLWFYSPAPAVYLVPKQTYGLTLSGSQVYGFNLLGVYVPDPSTLPSATNGNQNAAIHYRAYIWNTNSVLSYYNPTNHTTQTQTAPGWEPLCDANLPGWNTESEGDGSCDNVSLTVLIQIRPDGSARPLPNSAADEEDDESGNRDESAIDARTAPGDGSHVAMAAGQSLDPSSLNISWSVELGRLWNGASAGKILFLAQRLNDGVAYTPAALSYGARSSDTNEVDVLNTSSNSTVLRQIKTPQALVNINMAAATGIVSRNSHGVLTNVTLNSIGGRYAAAPTVTVNDPLGQGSNAVITAQLSADGFVNALLLVNGGTNYSKSVSISIAAPSNSFALDFYLPSAITGTDANGFFIINAAASPFVSWWIDSPNGSLSSWRLREMRNGATRDTTLQYTTSGAKVWTLTEGVGTEARVETRTIVTNISSGVTNRQETQQVATGGGVVSDKTIESYLQFPWGWQLAAVTNDPAGAKLATTFSYGTDTNTGDYGQLTFTLYPDGFWEQRVYGDTNIYPYPYDVTQGVLFRVINPWLNGPSGPIDPTSSDLEQCLVTQYGANQSGVYGDGSYGLVKWHNAAANGEDESCIRSLIESRSYAEETIFNEEDCFGGGEYLEETHSIGEADNESRGMPGRTTDRWEGSYGRLGGANYSVADTCVPGGEMDCYDYEFGQWNAATYTFATNGPVTNDVRKIVYHTSATWTIGFAEPFDDTSAGGDLLAVGDSGAPMAPGYLSPGQSTKDVTILQNGCVAARQTYAYTGSGGYALIKQVIYQRDCLGHATNIFLVDPLTAQTRYIYKADWQGGNTWPADMKLSDTDESGTTTTYTYDSLKRVTARTKQGVSASGYPAQASIVTSYAYDAADRVLTNSIAAGGVAVDTVSSYDLCGRLTSRTTPDQLTTSYTYSGGGRQTNITYSSDATMVTSNYLDRRLASITGSAVTNQYFTYGQIYALPASLFQPVDENVDYIPRNFTTNTLGNPASRRWTVTATDSAGNQCLLLQPAFRSANPHYSYDFRISNPKAYGTFETTALQNGDGSPRFKTSLYCYDFLGNVISEVINVCSNYYDDMSAAGWVSMDRGYSNHWSYQSDGSGAWFKVTQHIVFLKDNDNTPTILQTTKERLTGFTANQKSETLVYDVLNNLTDTNISVDFANAKVTTTVAFPQSTQSAVSVVVNGLLQTETTPTVSGPTWHFYDALGRETGRTDPLGFSLTRSYDPITGQTTSQSDPAGNVTTYFYYPAGGTNAGLLHYEVNAAGARTYYGYDGCGRFIHKWGDVPYPEEVAYDQFGDLASLHAYRGGSGWSGATWPGSPGSPDTTTWSFDEPTGLLTNQTDSAGNSVSFTYNADGFLFATLRARGASATNVYDELNDLTGKLYSDSTPAVLHTNQDRRGLPRGFSDASGSSSLAYDVLGRLTNQAWTSGVFNGLTRSNHFNTVYGRDAVAVLGLSAKVEADYGYDAFGRLDAAATATNRVGYSYVPNSDLIQSTISSNGAGAILTVSRQWDFGFRLRDVTHAVNSAPITSRAYSYDNLNRPTEAMLEDGSAWSYSYDSRNELAAAGRVWPDWTPVTGQQFVYTCDNAGNRLTAQSGSAGSLRTAGYSANGLDEYTNLSTPGYKDILGQAIATNPVTINGGVADRKGEYFHRETVVTNSSGPVWHPVTVTAGGSLGGGLVFPGAARTPVYDLDGELLFDGVWNYSWDAENRLVAMTMVTNVSGLAASNRLRLDFAYDSMDRRISKIISTNSSGSTFVPQATNYYFYDGPNLLASFNPAKAVQQSFLWGLDLGGSITNAGGIGGLVMASLGGSNEFAACDAKGNVLLLVSAADKSIAARYEYSPFGEVLRATGPLAKQNPFGFSTKFYDGESGLLYYGRRFYNPSQGRWVARDATPAALMNLYLFCDNNPLKEIDPDGCNGLDPAELWGLMEQFYTLAQKLKETDPAGAASAMRAYENFKFLLNETCAAIRVRGVYWGGLSAGESGFIIPEMAELGGAVVSGAAVGIGAGLLYSYVIDQAAKGLSTVIKAETEANNAIIDYWSDSGSKFQ